MISFVQLIILYLVVNTFMKLFEFDNPVYRISRILIFSTPLFGAFAVNVTYDVTLTAGVILLCALNFKDFGSQQKSAPILYVFSYLLLLTSFTGIPIIIVSLLIHAVSIIDDRDPPFGSLWCHGQFEAQSFAPAFVRIAKDE